MHSLSMSCEALQLRRRGRGPATGEGSAAAPPPPFARYRPERNPHEELVPFAIEARGCAGAAAIHLLRAMAPSAIGLRAKALSHAWHELSVLVQTRRAELLLAAEAAGSPA